ncbi:MAG TPA: DUF4010 domain-containing protein [Candidatus Acidoferrales bacterium]|nr:DUF4010 domain-containing protein [Candidatus Acidoferrales bacterium]
METPEGIPPLLVDFLLASAFSFLIGLALKEYYLSSKKTETFGSTRTYVFIGMLGFVLFQLQEQRVLYLGGLLVLGGLLAIYYHDRLGRQRFGMIGILTALLTYLLGPISLQYPRWFLVLFVITVLLVLNSKAKIRVLTERLADREIITLAKFLLLAGVILPLVPDQQIVPYLPVTPYQTWLAVVVITSISYAGYLVQTYLFQNKGLLVTGAIGGVYSSTATTVVLAKKAHEQPSNDAVVAASIILATAIMYLRLLVVVGIFNLEVCARLLAPFLLFAALGAALATLVYRSTQRVGGPPTVLTRQQNPLELGPALLFAGLFVFIAAATKFVLSRFSAAGLHWMSAIVGVADIDPFILSLLQGRFSASADEVVKAIVIASASNNLLKAVYAASFGDRRTGLLAGGALLLLTVIPLVYCLVAL